MSEWRQIYRSVVFPWHCDQYGHMNVRWYAHHFDDAGFSLWGVIGCAQSAMRERGFHPVVAQTKIDYLREMSAGDLILIEGAITRVGTKSCAHALKMYDADTRVHCATQESVEVFYDPETRKSRGMPDDIRAILEAALVPADEA